MLSEREKQWIRAHLSDDVRHLALQNSFPFPAGRKSFLLQQIAGRQQIQNKIPSWYAMDELVYPARLSLEQCSSEQTAQYKASLVAGDSLMDLTGGFGVDTIFMAPKFRQVDYVEKQCELAEIVQQNVKALGLNQIQIHQQDALDYLQRLPETIDLIYLDPARRSHSGEKIVRIEDCEPNVIEIQDLLLRKTRQVLLKLSPMLDIQSALNVLKNVQQVHVVSVENECKELLFLLQPDYQEEPAIICVNFRKKGNHPAVCFKRPEEKKRNISHASHVRNYLYEPNSSILKAGYYKGITRKYSVEKLHPDSHLYTSDTFISDFPGRIFQVAGVFAPDKKELGAAGIYKANLAVRNFPLSVAELRKKLNLKEGGEVYLFATTLADGKRVLIAGNLFSDSIFPIQNNVVSLYLEI
ncbi:MAG: class I SAM-dependent methyltransferase [Dysgonamonadaceae bacterium]|jgi:hypothetical protein|nr:class I SAM-dependent methyltransferase [Dysgonamonadaceae bacterium]